jgi:hypothetical protein
MLPWWPALVKIVQEESLISVGPFAESIEWEKIKIALRAGISGIVWPPGSDTFRINPVPHGSGVVAIRKSFRTQMEAAGWEAEGKFTLPADPTSEQAELSLDLDMPAVKTTGKRKASRKRRSGSGGPGDLDAVLHTPYGMFAAEWETGNISSSHRAVNKMVLGLYKKILVGAALVVPSRNLYPWLTDRIGNFTELSPYFELWKAIPLSNAVMHIFVVEHDVVDKSAPLIPKGTDGRARR